MIGSCLNEINQNKGAIEKKSLDKVVSAERLVVVSLLGGFEQCFCQGHAERLVVVSLFGHLPEFLDKLVYSSLEFYVKPVIDKLVIRVPVKND